MARLGSASIHHHHHHGAMPSESSREEEPSRKEEELDGTRLDEAALAQRRWSELADRTLEHEEAFTAADAANVKLRRYAKAEEEASRQPSPQSPGGARHHLSSPTLAKLHLKKAERFLASHTRLDHSELTAMELYLSKELPKPKVFSFQPMSPGAGSEATSRIA